MLTAYILGAVFASLFFGALLTATNDGTAH